MSKVYFKTKFQKGVFEYLKGEDIVVSPCGKYKYCYSREAFDSYVSTGDWIICNKDGSPIKTKKPKGVKRPTDNWKKTINNYKFDRCIKECVNLGAEMYYNPKTNCFYGKYRCDDNSEACFKYNLSKVPESKAQFKADVLTVYNAYLEEEMKQSALQRNHFNESEHPKEGDRELFDELKESLEECVNIKKERENGWTDKHYDFKYQLTQKDLENGFIKLDPYFVAKEWKIGSKDDSGALFHSFKLFPRWAEKNTFEREVIALYKQTKRMAEIYNIDLED